MKLRKQKKLEKTTQKFKMRIYFMPVKKRRGFRYLDLGLHETIENVVKAIEKSRLYLYKDAWFIIDWWLHSDRKAGYRGAITANEYKQIIGLNPSLANKVDFYSDD